MPVSLELGQSIRFMDEPKDVDTQGPITMPDANQSAAIAQEQWETLIRTAEGTKKPMHMTITGSNINITPKYGVPATNLPRIPNDLSEAVIPPKKEQHSKKKKPVSQALMEKRRRRQQNKSSFTGLNQGKIYEHGRPRK